MATEHRERSAANQQEDLRYYLGRYLTRNSMDEIFPNIYLGGSYAAENVTILSEKKITFVLSIMSKDLPPSTRTAYGEQSIDQIFIQKHDDSHEDILSVAGEVCDLIEENVQKGKGVLLHCAMGMSRSATIMAAFVMQRWGISRHDALTYVRGKRTIVNPNRGFRKQLDVWGECGHNVYSSIMVDGKKVPKEAYAEWQKGREQEKERAREREAAEPDRPADNATESP